MKEVLISSDQIREVTDEVKKQTGKSYAEQAREMGIAPALLAKYRTGERKAFGENAVKLQRMFKEVFVIFE